MALKGFATQHRELFFDLASEQSDDNYDASFASATARGRTVAPASVADVGARPAAPKVELFLSEVI